MDRERELVHAAYIDFKNKVNIGITCDRLSEYYNLYLDFLKDYLHKSKYEYAFVSAKDLYMQNDTNWDVSINPYIQNFDRLVLARDMEKRGTYWPVWFYTKSFNIRHLADGFHRIGSLKMINSDMLILGIENTPPLSCENQSITFPFFVTDEFIQAHNANYFLEYGYTLGDKLMPDCYSITVNQLHTARHNLTDFSRALADLTYKHNIDFPPSPIMTDKKAFDEWIGDKIL